MTTQLREPKAGDFAVLTMRDEKRLHAVYVVDAATDRPYWALEDGRRLASTSNFIKNVRWVRFISTTSEPPNNPDPEPAKAPFSVSDVFALFDSLAGTKKKAPEQKVADNLWKTVTDAVTDAATKNTATRIQDIFREAFNTPTQETPAPPPPPSYILEEPTGVNATVRLRDGQVYSRTSIGSWLRQGDYSMNTARPWTYIKDRVEEILWAGV